MANTKISDFSELTSPVNTDLFLTAQEDTSNKKLTWANLRLTVPWITYYSRPKYGFVSTDTITFGSGAYYLYGKGLVYWTSDITFTLGSGGSNANSDDLTASEWHYIAIDYSTVSAAGVLTASNFINRRAANVTPDYSGTKGGVYQDTDDRTIFGVLTNGSSQVLEFWHDGEVLVQWSTKKLELDGTGATSFTDVDCSSSMPKFSTLGLFHTYSGGGLNLYVRVNGSSDATGLLVAEGVNVYGVPIYTASSQIFEYRLSSSGDVKFYTLGWFFPAGM